MQRSNVTSSALGAFYSISIYPLLLYHASDILARAFSNFFPFFYIIYIFEKEKERTLRMNPCCSLFSDRISKHGLVDGVLRNASILGGLLHGIHLAHAHSDVMLHVCGDLHPLPKGCLGSFLCALDHQHVFASRIVGFIVFLCSAIGLLQA